MLIDQFITLDYADHLLGCELAVQLRDRGFRGLVCIISGGNKDTLAQLESLPAVDIARSKNTITSTLVPELCALLDARACTGGRAGVSAGSIAAGGGGASTDNSADGGGSTGEGYGSGGRLLEVD